MHTEPHVIRVTADGLADGDLARPGPVAVWLGLGAQTGQVPPPWLVGGAELLHIGPPDDPAAPAHDADYDARGCILIPGLVNAHSHLDLTAIGPRPYSPETGFVAWLDMVRTSRPDTPETIQAAVELGVQKSLEGGVVAVGDIIGSPGSGPTTAGLAALSRSPLEGVGFLEHFGIGAHTAPALAQLNRLAEELPEMGFPGMGSRGRTGIRAGLQPHAPNTVSIRVYRHAARLAGRLGLPLATHLAETPEERRFVAEGDGPQRAFLEQLGIWDDAELEHIGQGRHPIEHLEPVLETTGMLLAHVNDIPETDAGRLIEKLARWGASVVYCPRTSVYFGAAGRLGPHRYREMLDAGVNVCLGTDSIINLDTPGRISPLDDARLLHRRDGADARTLLAMLTTGGARALGLDPAKYTFRVGGALDGLVAVPISGGNDDPAAAVLASESAPRLLIGPRSAGRAGSTGRSIRGV